MFCNFTFLLLLRRSEGSQSVRSLDKQVSYKYNRLTARFHILFPIKGYIIVQVCLQYPSITDLSFSSYRYIEQMQSSLTTTE